LVPSPVAGDGIALVCAPKGGAVYGVKLSAKGTLADDGYAWKSEDRNISSDVPTPLFYRGKFFVLYGQKNMIAKIAPATGQPDWFGDLGARVKIEASPTGADGKIYVMNFKGEVFVMDAGDHYKLLHQADLGDPGDDQLRSSIAVSQGNLFVRTGSRLYCIGQ
jgi:outer membrane protein assembly factor BamB